MQKGIFVMLVVIAFLLGANLFQHKDVFAAKQYQYKVLGLGMDSQGLEKGLNSAAMNGWEFAGFVSLYNSVIVVLKK